MFDFSQIDTDYTVVMTVDGDEYDVEQFHISFNQQTDYKGEPQAEVRGGKIHVTISEVVTTNLYTWAMTSSAKEGSIHFQLKSAQSPLKVDFLNAYCVFFQRNVNSLGEGLTTQLVISPEEVNINDISFDNHWEKSL